VPLLFWLFIGFFILAIVSHHHLKAKTKTKKRSKCGNGIWWPKNKVGGKSVPEGNRWVFRCPHKMLYILNWDAAYLAISISIWHRIGPLSLSSMHPSLSLLPSAVCVSLASLNAVFMALLPVCFIHSRTICATLLFLLFGCTYTYKLARFVHLISSRLSSNSERIRKRCRYLSSKTFVFFMQIIIINNNININNQFSIQKMN